MYKVKISDFSLKQLKKFDKQISKIILDYIETNLENTENPKTLQGDLKGLWRYKVKDYRIIANIKDDILIIERIFISHKKQVYKQISNRI